MRSNWQQKDISGNVVFSSNFNTGNTQAHIDAKILKPEESSLND